MSTIRVGDGNRPRLAFRSAFGVPSGLVCAIIIKALPLDPGVSLSDVPPLGSEKVSGPWPSMAVPGGGTNGANGFATVDEDAAVIDVGYIVPLLPLPCGNGSNFWSDDTITLVVSKDVDAIVVDMIFVRISSASRNAKQFEGNTSEHCVLRLESKGSMYAVMTSTTLPYASLAPPRTTSTVTLFSPPKSA